MSLVGHRARNHPQQVKRFGPDRYVDDRRLPDADFAVLHKRFDFTLDVAASIENARLPRFHTLENCGLRTSWVGERVYCNPPYSDIRPWVQKAVDEITAELVVLLLPANRTEQAWWQDLIEHTRDREGSPLRVEFQAGRQRFIKPGDDTVKPNQRPAFSCCLAIWDRRSK